MVKFGLIASGKWSLKYMQTPSLRKLEGWPQRKSLYPAIASLGSSDEVKESKKVSVRQKVSNWWTFKKAEICESLKKSSTQILFKFQSQTIQGASPPTRPGIGLNIPRLHDDKIAIKHVKKLKFSSSRINARKQKILKKW